MQVYFVAASSDYSSIYGSMTEMISFNAHSGDLLRVHEPLACQNLEPKIQAESICGQSRLFPCCISIFDIPADGVERESDLCEPFVLGISLGK